MGRKEKMIRDMNFKKTSKSNRNGLTLRHKLVLIMSIKRTTSSPEEITFNDKIINALIWGCYNFFGTLMAVVAGSALAGATEILTHPIAYFLTAGITAGWSGFGYLVLARGIK